jgi:hypothetical protein
MEDGKWKIENGRCKMEDGRWKRLYMKKDSWINL